MDCKYCHVELVQLKAGVDEPLYASKDDGFVMCHGDSPNGSHAPVGVVSNVVTKDKALVGVYTQYYEGAITYGELLQWLVNNVPPPCDDPLRDTAYRCVIAAIATCTEVEKMMFEGGR